MIVVIALFGLMIIINLFVLISLLRKLNENVETIEYSIQDIRVDVKNISDATNKKNDTVLKAVSQFTLQAKRIEEILSNMEHNNDLLLYSKLQDATTSKE